MCILFAKQYFSEIKNTYIHTDKNMMRGMKFDLLSVELFCRRMQA